MGFLTPNYEKEGPGVKKDERKKKGIFLFFEILFRRFVKLMKSGMLLFIFSLPTMLLMSFIVFMFVSNITSDINWQARLMISFTVMITLIWGSGPASSGFAYTARCYTRKEHSWIVSDFFERLKKNLKQGLIVTLIDLVVLTIGGTGIYSYITVSQQSGSVIWFALCNLSILAMLIYTFMHIHIYQIMISYECTIKELYKNSLILALGKAPMNLFIVLVMGFINITVFDITGPMLGLLVMLVVFFGPLRFIAEFYAARTLSKIIPKEEV